MSKSWQDLPEYTGQLKGKDRKLTEAARTFIENVVAANPWVYSGDLINRYGIGCVSANASITRVRKRRLSTVPPIEYTGRNDTYFTEELLLSGYPEYKTEELTGDELELYSEITR